MRIETKLVHAGDPKPRVDGAVSFPIFQSSTFEHGGEGGYHEVRYLRLNNTPNHELLGAKLAAIEGGEAGLVSASGMAAISSALLALLSAGDHMLAHVSLYGGTHSLLSRDLAQLGISVSFVDGADPDSWAAQVTPRTKLFYVESITNPLMQVVALEEVAGFCRERGLTSVVDNTMATPVNFRPIECGYDLVLHSATKYLNGHTDLVAGAAVGSAELIARIKRKLDHLGASLDPHACFLLQRGMKTLALRVRYQNQAAAALARFLAGHPAVARVNYPGLPQHPSHERAQRLFAGMGGMLSFEHGGGAEAAERFLSRTELAVSAPSLGGPETLVSRPATSSHAGLSAAERARAGISDALVRVSVGLEAVDDLIADFEAALA